MGLRRRRRAAILLGLFLKESSREMDEALAQRKAAADKPCVHDPYPGGDHTLPPIVDTCMYGKGLY
jgi:hypothetical protein